MKKNKDVIKPNFGVIGYHCGNITSSKDMIDEIEKIKQNGANIMQIFLSSPSTVEVQNFDEMQLNTIKNKLSTYGIKLVIHSSYMHNLSKNWDKYSWWIKNIIQEINTGYKMGGEYLVIHLGKTIEKQIGEAYNNMYTSLLHIYNETKNTPIKILIETSSGQGSEMCYLLPELAYFYKKLSKNHNKEISKRFGICLDTCHIFAAGYDIRTPKKIVGYLSEFEERIGIHHIKLVHFNDSKEQIGKKIDRHQNIGNGYIGEEGLIYLAKYFIDLGVPLLLETPNDNRKQEIEYINKKLISQFSPNYS